MTNKKMADGNTGSWNSGDSNTGNSNTGSWNTGDRNSGNDNTGFWNTGDSNSGDSNSGNRNYGNDNTGSWNSGNDNTGSWNSGNDNTGFCNTISPTVWLFNKDSGIERKDIKFPEFFYFELCEWVYTNDMTNKEKKEFPSYVTTGGYLKTREYKEAFIESWENADKEDREKVKDLPNFDADIFYEISGIRVGPK